MEQQVHFTTLATADLDAARRFYVEGLGWRPLLDVPGEIVFFQIAPGTVLAFFEAAKFAQDLGRGPALHHDPAVHEDDLVGDVAGERDLVGHDDHRRPVGFHRRRRANRSELQPQQQLGTVELYDDDFRKNLAAFD